MFTASKKSFLEKLQDSPIFKAVFNSRSSQRTVTTRNNVLYSFFFRGAGMTLGLWMVPLMLRYLNVEKYGIWLTLTSVVAWFNFFDVGLGNGLRNKLAEALAQRNEKLAQQYVSTTYAILTIIVCIMAVSFLILYKLIDWSRVLNVSRSMNEELTLLVLVVFLCFALRFVTGLITTVLNADQKIGRSSFLDFLSSAFSLVLVYAISKTMAGSLLYLGTVLSAVPAIVMLVSGIWFYRTSYRNIKPSFSGVKFSLTKDLLHLSLQFFVLQAVVLLIFFSSNIIIAQLLGPSKVSEFNIVYKYFSVITTVSVLIINPFWSAATEAFFKEDYQWLRSSSSHLIKIWVATSCAALLMAVLAQWAFSLWIGSRINISNITVWLMFLFVLILSWQNSFVYLINGIGKIRLQLYIYLIMGLLFVPMSWFFIRVLGTGLNGSILAMIVCMLPASVLIPVQFNRITKNRAKGIFNQ